MASIVNAANRKYNLTRSDVLDGDPRVMDWFLMDNLGTILIITVFYLLMVKHGPSFMERRQPFEMPRLMVVYNFALVILSAYIFIEMTSCGVVQSYAFFCQPVNYDNTEIGYREANAAWWYFFSKVIELADTLFFILRKKNRQLTFLHVYHHSTMMIICWYVARYVPGGEKFYNGGFNSLVHVFMYAYYGLAAMGPQVQKYLWWKKHLTKFQLIQFTFVNIRCVGTFFNQPCEYPVWINVVALFYSTSLLLLFSDFYVKSYTKRGVTSGSSPSKSITDSSSTPLTGKGDVSQSNGHHQEGKKEN